ncbi:MAG: choice-of-anchor L domain-containing protein [Saprospiraceae bacterium]
MNVIIPSHYTVCQYFVILLVLLGSNRLAAQSDTVSAVTSTDAEYLIREVFLGGGDCFEAYNFQLSGQYVQACVFVNGQASIGMGTGIILSNGNVEDISGPNTGFGLNDGGVSTGYGTVSMDEDLRILDSIAGDGEYDLFQDVVILEFDFVPTLDTISFEFVFASDEYCNFIFSSYIDLFGFFISGPGINGPYTNNGINIAVSPATQEDISARNINNFINAEYYINNIPPGVLPCSFNAVAAAPDLIAFDGFTVPLIAKAGVIPCETYHLRLVVADRGVDDKLDAAVFLRSNSFAAGLTSQITSEITSADLGNNTTLEGCGTGKLIFSRGDSVLTNPLVVKYDILASSTATPGLDFTGLPDSIILPAGVYSDTIELSFLSDNIPEGTEFFTVKLRNPCNCGESEQTIFIVDPPPLNVQITGPNEVCAGSGLQLNAVPISGVGTITYQWPNGDIDTQFNFLPAASDTYALIVSDDCNQRDTISYFVEYIDPVAQLSGDLILCDGRPDESLRLVLSGADSYNFNLINGSTNTPFSNIMTDTLWIPVSGNGVYALTGFTGDGCVGDANGFASSFVVQINTQTTVENVDCNGNSTGIISLLPQNGSGSYGYVWSHDTGLAAAAAMGLPADDYQITITDSNGCTDTVSVQLTEPVLLTAAIDTLVLTANCLEAGSLSAQALGGTAPYSFSWSNGMQNAMNPNLPAGDYLLTVTDANDCMLQLATSILADSLLPDIQLQALDSLDCLTSTITLQAVVADAGTQPVYNWTNSAGNMLPTVMPTQLAVTVPDTYTLSVANPENGCSQMASISVVDYTNIPGVGITGVADINCQQTAVSLAITGLDADWESVWFDEAGSIVANNIPTYTATSAGQYHVLVTDPSNGCSARDTVVINAFIDPPSIQLVQLPDTIDCITNTVTINTQLSGNGSYTYNWMGTTVAFWEVVTSRRWSLSWVVFTP